MVKRTVKLDVGSYFAALSHGLFECNLCKGVVTPAHHRRHLRLKHHIQERKQNEALTLLDAGKDDVVRAREVAFEAIAFLDDNELLLAREAIVRAVALLDKYQKRLLPLIPAGNE